MTLKDDLTKYVRSTFSDTWTVVDGRVVPNTDSNIGLGNAAVKISATVLYADLSDSTGLVKSHEKEFAAEVYKSYVYTAAKLIRSASGSVTAYDGDRVMGVFMGDANWSAATRVALKIEGAVEDIIKPELARLWPNKSFVVAQKCGISYSEIWVANTGIRGNNDYVWVGTAANDAAKMAALKKGYSTYITGAIYDVLDDALKTTNTGSRVWDDLGTNDLGYKIWGARATISL
jgi:class 3 adenylate cyclase